MNITLDKCSLLINSAEELRTWTDERFEYFLSHSPYRFSSSISRTISSIADLPADYYDADALSNYLQIKAFQFLSTRFLFSLAGFEQTLAEYLMWDDRFSLWHKFHEHVTDAYRSTSEVPERLLADPRITQLNAIRYKVPGRAQNMRHLKKGASDTEDRST